MCLITATSTSKLYSYDIACLDLFKLTSSVRQQRNNTADNSVYNNSIFCGHNYY